MQANNEQQQLIKRKVSQLVIYSVKTNIFGVSTAGKKEKQPSISGSLETTCQSYDMDHIVSWKTLEMSLETTNEHSF